MVWFWSHMARFGDKGLTFKRKDYLSAAEHGVQFLCKRMRDNEHGGYFWEVDKTGKKNLLCDIEFGR